MVRLLRTIVSGSVAMEENSDGKIEKEREIVFYGRVLDMEQLKEAHSMEHQEQWEIRIPKTDENALSGRMRIRKTVLQEGQAPEYVFTTKTPTPDNNTSNSIPIPTTEAHFMQFKMLAPAGMIKDRYNFEIEGTDLKWEVDMFRKPEGGYFEWAKLDLEIPMSYSGPIPPPPLDMADIITGQYGNRTEAEEAKIHTLYEFEFITKNQYLKKDDQAQPEN
jgi:hypothetical protein